MMELQICIGSSCHVKGSYNIINIFQHLIEEYSLHDKIDLQASFCMKQCRHHVSVAIDGEWHSVSPETASQFFQTTVMAKIK
ncbi:MAG TPA: NADH-quinone oxidoreductase subunit F [Firmicutes bacterium]|jgi:NADH:ubiquinone oxidoreductase subunit E|nr:NADH-quinone oxidoreductase subunit F [Bacillota bacterium]